VRFLAFCRVLAVLLLGGATATANPYRSIDFDAVRPYRANLHTHTAQSDGHLAPHEAVDAYHELGYSILALTDHDLVTWPWTEFSALTLHDKARRMLQMGGGRLPYQNRDPAALNMLAVQGAEASRHHHTGTYFCDVPGQKTLEDTLDEVRRQNGLAVLFHPGRYQWPDEKYLALFRDERLREVLVGLEVFNQGDRFLKDRALWDRLLTELMPDRPVWGYSGDDMHHREHIGRNWIVFFLPELTEQALRDAMVNGRSYFCRVRTTGDKAPVIHRIETSPDGMILTIRATGHKWTAWFSEGRRVHWGDQIDLRQGKGVAKYVRAQLPGKDGQGTSFTQPFAVPQPCGTNARP